MSKLNPEQTRVHDLAIELAKQHRNVEARLVQILQDVERLKIHRQLGKRSVFQYATECLKLDDGVAYPLIAIARKSVSIPELKTAIEERTLTVSKANRIVSSLTAKNATELIDFAKTHTKSEIEFEMAKRNPKAATRDKMKPLSEDVVEVKITISKSTFEKLKRVESLQTQKGQDRKWGALLEVALDQYLEKHDPVRKAARAHLRKLGPGRANVLPIKAEVSSNKQTSYSSARIPLTAEQKHAVFLRDQGKCTHTNLQGQRCNQDHWTEIHHIISVANGGTNALENLTTLCSFHHDLVHQLSLPIEGQVTWLRSPRVAYG